MASSWTDNEPGWNAARELLAMAASRARARWLSTLFVATGLTAVVLLIAAQSPPRYQASIVLAVQEGERDPDAAPASTGDLVGFVEEVFLTRTRLLSLIHRHGLYPEALSPDPSLALEAMQDDLELGVVQNYFAPERYLGSQTRSARIVITYAGRHPDEALSVVRDLGREIVAVQRALRAQQSRRTAAAAHFTQLRLAADLSRARREQVRLNGARGQSTRGLLRVVRLQGEIEQLGRELALSNARSERFAFRHGVEGEGLGLRFDLVDDGTRAVVWLDPRQRLSLMGVIVFAIMLPVSGLLLGTLRARVDDARALERLGIAVLGHLRWPPRPGGESTSGGSRQDDARRKGGQDG